MTACTDIPEAAEQPVDHNASPQLEHGYTRIANELIEAILRFGFSKQQLLILWAVIRKTYGFGKRADDMPLTHLAQMTGLHLSHVSKTVRDLAERNVLLKRSGRYGYVLGIQKNYAKWRRAQKQPRTELVSDSDRIGNSDLLNQSDQKKPTKETYKNGGASARGDPVSFVWSAGVALLMAAGENEASARKLLGKLNREYGEAAVAEKIAYLTTHPKAEPKGYLIASLKPKKTVETHLLDMC